MEFTINLPKSVPPGSFAGGSVKRTEQGMDETFERSITIEFNDVDRTRLIVPIVRGTSQNALEQQ